jgi:hypothetical protein
VEFEQIVDPVPIPYSAQFSDCEFRKIRSGFKPRDMDDKWIVQYQKPYLWLNRSWTGIGVYRVEFIKNSDGAAVASAICAKSMLAFGDPHSQADRLKALIGDLLLDQMLVIPSPMSAGTTRKSVVPKPLWWMLWR